MVHRPISMGMEDSFGCFKGVCVDFWWFFDFFHPHRSPLEWLQSTNSVPSGRGIPQKSKISKIHQITTKSPKSESIMFGVFINKFLGVYSHFTPHYHYFDIKIMENMYFLVWWQNFGTWKMHQNHLKNDQNHRKITKISFYVHLGTCIHI